MTFEEMNDDDEYKQLYKHKDIPLTTCDGYECKCLITEVLDGDTVEFVMKRDNKYEKYRLRINGVDAPEIRTKNLKEKRLGLESKERLQDLLKQHDNKVLIKFYKDDKYGRKLGDIFINGCNVCEYMLSNHLGYSYDGHGKK